jgi:hypothetical protein
MDISSTSAKLTDCLTRAGRPGESREARAPIGSIVVAFFSLGISETGASVVSVSAAIEAAFCGAVRATFAGSMTPAFSPCQEFTSRRASAPALPSGARWRGRRVDEYLLPLKNSFRCLIVDFDFFQIRLYL